MTQPIKYFYLYPSLNFSISVLLLRTSKHSIEMIRWDTDTDHFIQGQWLASKHKNLDKNRAMISGDGLYFGYTYFTYPPYNGGFRERSYKVKSIIPNFTAHSIYENGYGHWEDGSFDDSYRGKVDFPYIDKRSRIITSEGPILYADGNPIYDASDHEFMARHPMLLDGSVATFPDPIWLH